MSRGLAQIAAARPIAVPGLLNGRYDIRGCEIVTLEQERRVETLGQGERRAIAEVQARERIKAFAVLPVSRSVTADTMRRSALSIADLNLSASGSFCKTAIRAEESITITEGYRTRHSR